MIRQVKWYTSRRPVWVIPMIYVGATLAAGFTLPRLEHAYLASYNQTVSVASAQAVLSSIASGMMALTGIVFSLAFVMVQFSAAAYSPRLVLWLSRDPVLYHSLGVFIATFCYALAARAWIDRQGSCKVPLLSTVLVILLLIASTMLFARLVQRLSSLQITRVRQNIGKRGRQVVRESFAVQALGQIEDLLRRLGKRELEAGHVGDDTGALRVIFPTPTWEDYLTLAFDEIRQYGASSVQVMRRLRSARLDLAEAVPVPERRLAVQRYLEHRNLLVERHIADAQDQQMALQEDRQGLGLSRKRKVKPTG
jgi:uncharacterized membrane protein